MERLLDLYIAREIGPEEYERKKARLLNDKLVLKQRPSEIEKGGGGWLEPAKGKSFGFNGHHGFATTKSCTSRADDLDVLNSFLLHLPSDQGMKFSGSCGDATGPHVEVDLGPVSSFPKRKIEGNPFLDFF
jgi:hypothetical protein